MTEITDKQLKSWRRQVVAVDVPEIVQSGQLFVTHMSALDQLEFADRYVSAEAPTRRQQIEMIDALLDRTICHSDGRRRLKDGEIAALDLPWTVRMRLWQAAARLNGLTADTVESAEKNSEAPRTGSLRIA